MVWAEVLGEWPPRTVARVAGADVLHGWLPEASHVDDMPLRASPLQLSHHPTLTPNSGGTRDSASCRPRHHSRHMGCTSPHPRPIRFKINHSIFGSAVSQFSSQYHAFSALWRAAPDPKCQVDAPFASWSRSGRHHCNLGRQRECAWPSDCSDRPAGSSGGMQKRQACRFAPTSRVLHAHCAPLLPSSERFLPACCMMGPNKQLAKQGAAQPERGAQPTHACHRLLRLCLLFLWPCCRVCFLPCLDFSRLLRLRLAATVVH